MRVLLGKIKSCELVKQFLPFQTSEGYYNWLCEDKHIPSDVVKYLKYIK